MSIAISNSVPFVPPSPAVVPAQVQVSQGSIVPVPPAAVTASDKNGFTKESKHEVGTRSGSGDRTRGRTVDILV